jgi:sugar lactone lactonase YvrE
MRDIMQPEVICDYQCEIGENPLWHESERRLYWCDIPTGRVFRYDPRSRVHEHFYCGEIVGGFTIQSDGSLLLFMARGAVKLWRDGSILSLIEEIPEERSTRFNDVIADPAGRVLCGTMPAGPRPGRLYKLDRSLKLTLLLEGIRNPNGLGFTPDRCRLYFVDSLARTIYVYNYDEREGTLSNQRVFLETPETDGLPDGMTVDSGGYVWCAFWDGNVIVRYTPNGKEERRIAIPARKATSLIFGGDDYTDIYITSGGGQNKEVEGEGAGALFRLNLGIVGLPEFRSRIGLE